MGTLMQLSKIYLKFLITLLYLVFTSCVSNHVISSTVFPDSQIVTSLKKEDILYEDYAHSILIYNDDYKISYYFSENSRFLISGIERFGEEIDFYSILFLHPAYVNLDYINLPYTGSQGIVSLFPLHGFIRNISGNYNVDLQSTKISTYHALLELYGYKVFSKHDNLSFLTEESRFWIKVNTEIDWEIIYYSGVDDKNNVLLLIDKISSKRYYKNLNFQTTNYTTIIFPKTQKGNTVYYGYYF